MLRRALALLLLAGPVAHVRAAGLEVVPILVELERGAPRASLLVRNLSDAPARMELAVSAWTEGPAGEAVLGPAPNLVVYPPLLELPPRGERKVRVSATSGFGSVEGAYRLFVSELPSPDRPAQKNAVRFLTRVGVPVFLLPPKKLVRLTLAEAAVRGGKLGFLLRNEGNTRLYPTQLTVEGLGSAGDVLFSGKVDAWYVLAGGQRALEYAVPKADCAKVRKLTIELTAGKIPVRTGVETPGGACAP